MKPHIELNEPILEPTCAKTTGIETIRDSYAEYTSDESKKTGLVPECIYFPESTAEVSAAMVEIAGTGKPVTVSGARTGIAGGAVASAENLLSLSRMLGKVKITAGKHDTWYAHVPAGLSLEDLNYALRQGDVISDTAVPDNLFYPVDPTEKSASVGGTVATNASGARTLKYGPTRDWVQGMDVVLADGSWFSIGRGATARVENTLSFQRGDSVSFEVPIKEVPWPATKHTAGYFMRDGMDPIDLFIGGEGTLGIVTHVALRLCELPSERLGLFLFLPSDVSPALVPKLNGLSPSAVEYMDGESLKLLNDAKDRKLDAGAVPDLPDDAAAALYVEIEAESDDAIEEAYEQIQPLLDEFGIPEDHTWAGFSDQELEAMKAFRHALPERINNIIAERKRTLPKLAKIGTDMAVPLPELNSMMELYNRTLREQSLEYCIFGHIGNGHLHVNMLPRSMDERETAYALYREFAWHAVKAGGSVAGEHGIGSLKREYMEIQFSKSQLESMIAVKRALDPSLRLNPGVIFDL